MNGHGGVGWEEQRSRRFFRSGELHLVLLALLGSRPQHGYELLSQLAARFGPAYQPSPGSVYPALSALEAEGLLLAEDDGDRRVYRLSTAGTKALEERRVLLGTIEARTGARLDDASVEPALARFGARVRAVADRVDPADLQAALDQAAARVEQLVKKRKKKR